LFSNLNIETQREVAKDAAGGTAAPAPAATDPSMPKPEVVSFTVKANFGMPKPQPAQPATAAPASQVAMKK
jgi:hypothetical protein